MSTTLQFQGGLFSCLTGTDYPRRVIVQIVEPGNVEVTRGEEHDAYLEDKLKNAKRIDIESDGEVTPEVLPIRAISHLIPIDFSRFKKVVSFSNGVVSGSGVVVSEDEYGIYFPEPQDAKTRFSRFRQFTKTKYENHAQEYVKKVVDEFYKYNEPERLARWKAGYVVEVEIDDDDASVIWDGRIGGKESIKDLKILFKVSKESTIPHFPLDNPHVLEQPPTI